MRTVYVQLLVKQGSNWKLQFPTQGPSFRTDRLLTSPEFSNIRNHAHENNHPIRDCNFKILDTCNSFDLRLLESIYIHKKNLPWMTKIARQNLIFSLECLFLSFSSTYTFGKWRIDKWILLRIWSYYIIYTKTYFIYLFNIAIFS